MKKPLLIFTMLSGIVLSILPAKAQEFTTVDVPFYKMGENLYNSNHPGIDASLLSSADLDGNGEEDLIIHSLISGTISTYIKQATGLEFTRDYQHSFPSSYFWVDYVDVNCDGIKDRISYADSFSLSLEQGYYVDSKLSFQEADIIIFSATNPLFDPLDIPIFFDEDGDGDLDIISSPLPGTSLHLYDNIGSGCSFENFSLSNQCWGDFSMSFSSDSIFLNSGCPQRIGIIASEEQMHFVPTFQLWDYESDGDMDLFIGNSLGSGLEVLVNNGFNIFTEHLESLDFLDIQVDVSERPFPFLYDFDNDGIDDLLVNKSLFSDNEKDFSWLYQADTDGQFSLVSQNALNSLGPDLGSGISPVWKDVDGDGLVDIVYSNLGRGGTDAFSTLKWIKNIGTIFSPEFEIIENDLIDISELELSEVRFSFGHLDADSSEDLFLSSYSGESYFILDWQNNLNSNLEAIDLTILGSDFSPVLIDINEDGIDDLLIGERNGNINYLENQNLSEVSFTLITENFGEINTQIPDYPWGESYLSKHYDIYGNLLLYVMDSESQLASYLIDGVDPHSALSIVENIDLSFYSESLCGQSLDDINNDGIDDLIIAHPEGGIEILSRGTDTYASEELIIESSSIMISPNPFTDVLSLRSLKNETFDWTIYDLSGKAISSNRDSNIYILNTEILSPGLYLLEINRKESQIIVKH